jgi:hypothetical protein
MNRRRFALLLPAVGLMAACDSDQKPSHSATLLNNADVQHALKALSNAISGLEGNVDRFENENWREVVPDVEISSAEVFNAFNQLESALGVKDK